MIEATGTYDHILNTLIKVGSGYVGISTTLGPVVTFSGLAATHIGLPTKSVIYTSTGYAQVRNYLRIK
jgi:hypothetical protein